MTSSTQPSTGSDDCSPLDDRIVRILADVDPDVRDFLKTQAVAAAASHRARGWNGNGASYKMAEHPDYEVATLGFGRELTWREGRAFERAIRASLDANAPEQPHEATRDEMLPEPVQMEAKGSEVSVPLPPDMRAQFRGLGVAAGALTFTTDRSLTAEEVVRVREVVTRLDGEAQIGGALIETIQANDPNVGAGDVIDTLSVSARRLGLLEGASSHPEDAGVPENRMPPEPAMLRDAMTNGPVIFQTAEGQPAVLRYVGAGEYTLQVGRNVGHVSAVDARGTCGDVEPMLSRLNSPRKLCCKCHHIIPVPFLPTEQDERCLWCSDEAPAAFIEAMSREEMAVLIYGMLTVLYPPGAAKPDRRALYDEMELTLGDTLDAWRDLYGEDAEDVKP